LKNKKLLEKGMEILFLICACVSIVSVALICFFIFVNGVPAIAQIGFFKFIFGTEWSPSNEPPSFGILPMIVGSLYITAGAIIVGVPIGLLAAIFMSKFCPKWLYRIIKPSVNLLAGIPSIVYGFFGVVVLVPLVKKIFHVNGNTILTASILLGVMILPTIINLSEAAINAVPESYYEGAIALGATHERAVASVMFPAAKSGILAAIILGIGRAIGETMAVIMVAGNQPRITTNILKGIRTLTSNIVLEMGYAAELHRGALIGTGVVLFVFILLLNISFSIISNKRSK
jgi:phosphate transport system permease protein